VSDTASHPLTDQALKRLRDLATGNGLTPEMIHVTDIQEKIYTLEATLTLTPLFETQNGYYAGPVIGRNKHILGSAAELKQDLERRQQEFKGSTSWISAVTQELKSAQGSGWGYNDATISLADRSLILTASSPCPQCKGRQLIACQFCQASGQVLCPQCLGRRLEPCFMCGGRGQTQSHEGGICGGCNGTGLANCRLCQAQGQTPCPHCKGRGGTSCASCRGTGLMTEEIAITCGAKTLFKITSEGLPTGLRRGLDRLEFVNLSKGHADIEMLAPAQEDDVTTPGDNPSSSPPPNPVIDYRATMPYADIKVSFGKERPVLISVFGKRGIMSGVPPFLDASLTPWRDKLAQAAQGKVSLKHALEARALSEAFCFEVAHKDAPRELRKLYPIGLSSETSQEIIKNLRLALNLLTLKLRAGIAVTWTILSAVLLRFWFVSTLHTQMTMHLSIPLSILFDSAVLSVVMLLGWISLSASIHIMLRQHFPGTPIPLKQKIGKTGTTMMASLFVIFLILLWLTPVQSPWLLLLKHVLKISFL